MTFLLTGFHKVSLITCFFPGIGTNALVTEIVFTFVAMPRPVFIWVPKQRSAVITSPATSGLWVDIQCACSEQCMLVQAGEVMLETVTANIKIALSTTTG